jgi:4a-hydroxytetrahydrobiopterin dehydratase
MTSLAQMHCRPLGAADRLPDDALPSLLAQLEGWTTHEGPLQKAFGFPDFARTMAFVNAVAAIAEAEDHHPELQLSWGRCTVQYRTHSAGGLTINDFICAARVDALTRA